MAKIDTGGPAYPACADGALFTVIEGMTWLDVVATAAMQGMMAADTSDWCMPEDGAGARR